jgi:hypothetical protein
MTLQLVRETRTALTHVRIYNRLLMMSKEKASCLRWDAQVALYNEALMVQAPSFPFQNAIDRQQLRVLV